MRHFNDFLANKYVIVDFKYVTVRAFLLRLKSFNLYALAIFPGNFLKVVTVGFMDDVSEADSHVALIENGVVIAHKNVSENRRVPEPWGSNTNETHVNQILSPLCNY